MVICHGSSVAAEAKISVRDTDTDPKCWPFLETQILSVLIRCENLAIQKHSAMIRDKQVKFWSLYAWWTCSTRRIWSFLAKWLNRTLYNFLKADFPGIWSKASASKRKATLIFSKLFGCSKVIVGVVKKFENLTVLIRAWWIKSSHYFIHYSVRVLIWGTESEGVNPRDSAAPSLAKPSLSSEPRHFSWDELEMTRDRSQSQLLLHALRGGGWNTG